MDGICLHSAYISGFGAGLAVKINATTVKKLKSPAQGYALHWDEELKGFGVRITAAGKLAYIVQGRLNGKEQRKTLNKRVAMTPAEARQKAKVYIGKLAAGIDPEAEKMAKDALSVTLAEVAGDYVANHRRKSDGLPLKDRTKADILYHVDKTFGKWKDMPIANITRRMVQELYTKRAASSPAQANQAMRNLRAIIGYAAAIYRKPDGSRIIADNPVDVLKEASVLRHIRKRETRIPAEKLGQWWSVVQVERQNPGLTRVGRAGIDLFALMLLTGLRLDEARSLRWAEVDLEAGSLSLSDTKNRDDVMLPLSSVAVALLKARRNSSPWVFPARSGKGHFMRSEQTIENLATATGVRVTAHDLRRTFIQTAVKALGIELWRVKMLANHKIDQSDVTLSAYVGMKERLFLRDDAERIAQHYESQRAEFEAGNVLSLRERRA